MSSGEDATVFSSVCVTRGDASDSVHKKFAPPGFDFTGTCCSKGGKERLEINNNKKKNSFIV